MIRLSRASLSRLELKKEKNVRNWREVHWTSNGLQFLFDLLANNTDGVIWIQVNAQSAITKFQVIWTSSELQFLFDFLGNNTDGVIWIQVNTQLANDRPTRFDSCGRYEVQLWRILAVVLFPMLFDENDVIIVILNDLIYQSLEVYATSNELQLTASFACK